MPACLPCVIKQKFVPWYNQLDILSLNVALGCTDSSIGAGIDSFYKDLLKVRACSIVSSSRQAGLAQPA